MKFEGNGSSTKEDEPLFLKFPRCKTKERKCWEERKGSEETVDKQGRDNGETRERRRKTKGDIRRGSEETVDKQGRDNRETRERRRKTKGDMEEREEQANARTRGEGRDEENRQVKAKHENAMEMQRKKKTEKRKLFSTATKR